MAGCDLLPSSPLLGSSRFLQLLQRRAEEKRKHHFPLQTKTNTHSGLLIQHESVECREKWWEYPPLLPGGLRPGRLKTAPPLSSTVRSSRGQREPLDSSERNAQPLHHLTRQWQALEKCDPAWFCRVHGCSGHRLNEKTNRSLNAYILGFSLGGGEEGCNRCLMYRVLLARERS